MKNARCRVPVILVGIFLIILFGLNAAARYFNLFEAKKPATVPTIEIWLNDITLETINSGDKDTKYPGNNLTITQDGEESSYSNVEIKGRGNSTWGQEKKPYQIKFNEKVSMFGMGKAKKWVLLANFFDKSGGLRTDIAFYIERMINPDNALNGQYVNLIVDDENLGLYFLTPKVEVDKSRVDLKDPLGILVELDNLHTNEENFKVGNNHLQPKDLVAEDNKELAIKDFSTSVQKLMSAAKANDLNKLSKAVDLDSMVEYYLLSEFTINPDAYSSSLYLYKDGTEDVIHFAPGWDYDYSMGNKEWVWAPNDEYYSPYNMSISKYYDPKKENKVGWFVNTPEFYKIVGAKYRETMMGKKDELLQYFDEQVKYIKESMLYDEARWNGRFYEEVMYLRDWLSKRFDYFDEVYGVI
ncbi:CotH kinase family protein [Candidatus Saccharibacteria bacterium]|nr:CotH kinase family protein [Candidatus Saccharibacteria bacterium]